MKHDLKATIADVRQWGSGDPADIRAICDYAESLEMDARDQHSAHQAALSRIESLEAQLAEARGALEEVAARCRVDADRATLEPDYEAMPHPGSGRLLSTVKLGRGMDLYAESLEAKVKALTVERDEARTDNAAHMAQVDKYAARVERLTATLRNVYSLLEDIDQEVACALAPSGDGGGA